VSRIRRGAGSALQEIEYAANILEHFCAASNRENALSFCFNAIPSAKPLRIPAGIALG
jgi:hypothetical protein